MAEVRDVAKYFISKSEESTPRAITPLKLQKLVYYAQGFHLRDYGQPLFDNDLLAKDHGPAVPELYEDYEQYKYITIPNEHFENNTLSQEEIASLKKVWEKYGEFDGKFLEELTHQEDPWLFTPKNNVISIDKIRDFFNERTMVVI